MSHEPITCDRELLRRSLEDRLSDRQEEDLARHLADCAGCREELERLAGEEEAWSKVSQALKREADSDQSLARIRADQVADQDEWIDSAADFAVDFLEPSPAPETLGRLGDIDILEKIGRGGMGVVLKGFQPELKRLVAVKVLGPHLATSGPARKRFAREAQAAAAILHPNVMPILTVHSTGKLPFLVMPYVACESLHQRIARDGPLELLDILRIAVQTASGLAAAHAQGLVHRDVKPANILLEKGVDRVILTDFGLARAVDDASITCTGIIAGTPQFMSPEQARGEPVDARSDLFSLGSVLYTMAAGRPPFRAESTFGILRRITDSTPRAIREINPQVPSWLAAIIDKLMSKNAAERFATAEEVAVLLEQCLAHVQQPTNVPLPAALQEGPPGPTLAASPRLPLRMAGIAVAATIALVAIVWIARRDRSVVRPDEIRPLAGPDTTSMAPASDSDIDWDGAADQLEALRRDADWFEPRAERFWDVEPTPASASPGVENAATHEDPARSDEDQDE